MYQCSFFILEYILSKMFARALRTKVNMARYCQAVYIFSFLVINLQAAVIVQNENDSTTEIYEDTTSLSEKFIISYSSDELKEIDQDILQVIGDPANISLSCHYAEDNTTEIKWFYHGSHLDDIKTARSFKKHNIKLSLSNGPPVARLECVLRDNTTVATNKRIYTGVDASPYLYENQKKYQANVINESIATLPCLLKYPLDITEDKELQLFKDGQQVENTNHCLHYIPEQGFLLNLTKLEKPLGTYECRVVNSTSEDYLTVELSQANFIKVQYKGWLSLFHEKSPMKHEFHCSIPKSMFKDKFKWYFLLRNGTYLPFEPERKSIAERVEDVQLRYPPSVYVDMVLVHFDTKEIAQVVCASALHNDTSGTYNSSLTVNVVESYPPEILNDPNPKPIVYTKGKNITCASMGEPVPSFRWLKNGVYVYGYNISDHLGAEIKRSTLTLSPTANDEDSNYTCEVSNFLGNASLSFRVQAKPESEERQFLFIVVVAIVLAVLTVLLGALLTFFKIKVTRRFSNEKIAQFFDGLRAPDNDQRSINDYHSEPFDHSKTIKKDKLIFDKELKGGNFGKVYFGYYKKGTEKLPVAIKTIKDNPDASAEEIDYAFENFLREIKLMQYINNKHANVVGYVGAVTADLAKYSAFLLVEYCNKGDLATYLNDFKHCFHDDFGSSHRTSFTSNNQIVIKTSNLLKWAEDIAAGMEYISSLKILHMDLAARNILLHCPTVQNQVLEPHPDQLTARISDFGLSRDLQVQPKDYYEIVFSPDCGKKRVLPLRWLSLEALRTLKFTPENDVWSVGVTYWEMFTLMDVPYKELRYDEENFLKGLISYLEGGNTLREAEYAPSEMWDIMRSCWNIVPEQRPTFQEIRSSINSLLQDWKETSPPLKQQEFTSNYSQIHFIPSPTDEESESISSFTEKIT